MKFSLIAFHLLVSAGYGRLCDMDNGQPENSNIWGWNGNNGDQIGWIDEAGGNVYLNPAAAFKAVQEFNRSQGKNLPLTSKTLFRRLNEQGKLLSTDCDRNTKKISIDKKQVATLHLSV